MRGIGARQPVWGDCIVQAQCVEANLEGAHMQCSVGAPVVLAGRGLGEQNRRARVATGLGQHSLG